jgi:transcriptional regulator with XRE-family HTH domain
MAGLGKIFGSRVRALRSKRGLTQVQLADQAQVSEEWVRRIERGEGSPSFDTVEALANSLNVRPDELFAAETPPRDGVRLAQAVAHLSDQEIEWLLDGARLLKRGG